MLLFSNASSMRFAYDGKRIMLFHTYAECPLIDGSKALNSLRLTSPNKLMKKKSGLAVRCVYRSGIDSLALTEHDNGWRLPPHKQPGWSSHPRGWLRADSLLREGTKYRSA